MFKNLNHLHNNKKVREYIKDLAIVIVSYYPLVILTKSITQQVTSYVHVKNIKETLHMYANERETTND